MRLRVLGCSGGISAGLRTTSFLLDGTVLLDAGTGVGDLTLEEMCRIRTAFLTHTHLDHLVSIPLLVDTIFECIEEPLLVRGQVVTLGALRDHILNWTIWPDFAELPNDENPVMAYQPMKPGETVDIDGTAIEMIEVDHIVPGVAYRAERLGKSFCFSGDTSTNDTLWATLNGRKPVDLLIVECGFPNENLELSRLAKHYCPKLLADDLQKLEYRPPIALTHLKPGAEDKTFDQCVEALPGYDLSRLEHGQVIDL